MDKVWKLKVLDSELSGWRCFDIGGDELLGEMIEKLLRWKGEGQQVRLEWSERN